MAVRLKRDSKAEGLSTVIKACGAAHPTRNGVEQRFLVICRSRKGLRAPEPLWGSLARRII